jgi:protein TonB
MKFIRLLIGALLGLVVTVALFVLMPVLIETADKTIKEKDSFRLADITMPEREIEAQLKEAKPDKPQNPDEPPPDMDQPEMDDVELNPDAMNMTPQTGMDLSIDVGTGIGSSDGEFLPIVKVAPMYPRRANSRGIEGYCTVEYTVTKSGAIRDPRAVDCQPAGYFERSSIKAALKFKYKPRVIDGQPVDVDGVRNRFTFELEK